MPGFVRFMPWLQSLFPASGRPAVGPSQVSDDVQYTADYFGGGYSLNEPADWFSQTQVNKTANYQFVVIDQLPTNELTRLICMSIVNGGAAQIVALECGLAIRQYGSSGGIRVMLSETKTVIPAGAPQNYTQTVWHGNSGLILPPAPCGLELYFGTGDNVAYVLSFFFANAPRGATFFH